MSVAELRLLGDVELTPMMEKLLEVLSDGEKHTPQSLIERIDSTADRNNLNFFISTIRGRIYESGYLIAGHLHQRSISSYQLVRRLHVSLD